MHKGIFIFIPVEIFFVFFLYVLWVKPREKYLIPQTSQHFSFRDITKSLLPRGVQKTKDLLERNGIFVTGISGPIYREVKGIRFAFLGYNDIGSSEKMVSWADNETISREVRDAKKQADIVLVMYHWGVEYVRQPSTRQRELAHLTIDAGAELVLGNYPHWIQPLEIYQGKLIIYAHGNTIFDQMWSEETKYGVIGKYTFYDTTLTDVEYFPTYIKDFGQTVLLESKEKEHILKLLREVSIRS